MTTRRLLLHGGEVFDGTGRPPAAADIVVADGRILDVGMGLDGDDAVDATGTTLCPGIIDCHVHVTLSHVDVWRYLQQPASLVYYEAARNLSALLDAGITTVRDAAGADAGMRAAVEQRLIRGPRLLIAVTLISQTGGHSDGLLPSGCSMTSVGVTPGSPDPIADGVDGVRRKVREVLRAGADVIKIAAPGGILSPSDSPRHAHYTPEELAAAVDEARRAGRAVMAHAQATEGIKNAVRAGVRSIEHGIYLDDEAISMMLEEGTYLVPTLLAGHSIKDTLDQPGGLAAAATVTESIEQHRASFRAAVAAGVTIAMGTDAVGYPHGRNLEELHLMQQNGLPPLRTMRAATLDAAQLLGIADTVGEIAPGKVADLTAFAGRLDDLSDLRQRLRLVLQYGQICVDRSVSPPVSVE
jgi:imidazolonepropionase-like amidohydrolase